MIPLNVVSMFSGCGGMDLGFKQAGYNILWANDVDPDACDTYEANIGDIHRGDISKLDIPHFEDVDVFEQLTRCREKIAAFMVTI